jgi:hypothetical protein
MKCIGQFQSRNGGQKIDDVFGIAVFYGKNTTVSTIPVPFVFVMWTW